MRRSVLEATQHQTKTLASRKVSAESCCKKGFRLLWRRPIRRRRRRELRLALQRPFKEEPSNNELGAAPAELVFDGVHLAVLRRELGLGSHSHGCALLGEEYALSVHAPFARVRRTSCASV